MAATAVPGNAGTRKKRRTSTVNIATSHPIKVRCLVRMAERPTSPATIARECGVEAPKVSYHARKLEELDLIELVDERPVRGAIEHFFRTVDLAELSEEAYAALPAELRKTWLETIFGLFSADVIYSIETETLLKQTDCEVLRTAMKVDAQGWQDIREIYVEAQERVMAVKAEAETRLATDDELKPKPILSFFSLFEMPSTEKATERSTSANDLTNTCRRAYLDSE